MHFFFQARSRQAGLTRSNTLRPTPKHRIRALATAGLLAVATLVPFSAAPASAAAAEPVTCTVTITPTHSEAGFSHPGVGLTAPILENARAQIAAHAEPWSSYYEAMKTSGAASLTATSANQSTTTPGTPASDAFNSQGFNSRFIADGLTTYTQALMYVLTGTEQYRTNAMSIIRIWEKMDPAKYAYFADSHIHTGIPLNRMVTAAELLRYSSCPGEVTPWTSDDTAAFTQNLITPTIETFQHDNNYFMNQHNYPLLGAMAGYIFTEDKPRYDEAVEWFTVNATATDQGFNGSVERLFRLVDHDDKTGEAIDDPYVQHVEMGRDQAHGGGDLTNAAIISRMLLAQGTRVDPVAGTVSTASNAVGPYEFLDDRLLKAADYFWQYMLGYQTPWTPVAYAISPDGTIRDTYNSISPSYRGRFNTANFWDMYYYYTYVRGIDLQTVAPHFSQAFSQRQPSNFYYNGTLNQNWTNVDGGGDFWLYVPAEAEGSSLPVPQTSATVLPIKDRYSALAGSVSRETEGDTSFIRLTASTAGSKIAFLTGSTAQRQIGLRIRTTGSGELHLSPGIAESVPFPDTHGLWTTLVIPLSANDVVGDYLEIEATGSGAHLDLDSLNVDLSTSPAAPAFAAGTQSARLVSHQGSPVSLALAASDPPASGSLTYEASGLPAGATIDSTTGVLSWQPAGVVDARIVVWVTDGQSTTTARLQLQSGADRAGAISIAATGFDPAATYVAATRTAFETQRAAATSSATGASDGEFATAVQALVSATSQLQLVSPRLADGTLDYPSLLESSTVGASTFKLVDDDNQTGSSYTQAQNLTHTFDFGPDFRVTASEFGFESNIFSDRLANSAVFGSNDGISWSRLTPGVTAFTQDYQTLDVDPQLQDEQFRLIRVQLLEPQPDVLYGIVRNLFEMTEFHIYGERHEIDNKLASVSLTSPDAVAGLVDQGDVAVATVVAKEALQSVTVSFQGTPVAAVSDDGINWTASTALDDVEVGRLAVAVDYVDTAGRAGSTASVTTDGSQLLVGGAGSHRIDVAALASVKASDRQWPGTGLSADEVGKLLFDGDATTAGDLNTTTGSNYVVDFGSGLSVRPSTVYVLPRVNNSARANGTVLQGSDDRASWTDLSAPIGGATEGEWASVALTNPTGGAAFRYLRITNAAAWSGNLAEVVIYGDAHYDTAKFDSLVQTTDESTKGSAFTYTNEVSAIRSRLSDAGADRTAVLTQLLAARSLLVPASTLYPLIAVDRSQVLASSASWDNVASAADNGWRAFDGDTTTSPDTKTGAGWVRVDLGAGKATALASARLLPRVGNVGRMNGAEIQGSNDGTTFTTLGTVSGATRVAWYTLSVTDATAYRYLRYFSPNGFANIAEVEFHAGAVDATLLQLLAAQAENTASDGYTAASYSSLQTALAGARTTLDDNAHTQTQVDAASQTLGDALNGLVQEQPEPDGPAVVAPGVGTLSNTSGWTTGLADGNFDVTMNLWWGSNASTYELFENGTLVSRQNLIDSTPSAQNAVVSIRGRANGTYVYTGVLTNRLGSTETTSTTVTVTDASPGSTVLSSDNWGHAADYTVSFHLWWGTNATTYRLYENGLLIDAQSLNSASPTAQSGTTTVSGRSTGTYVYTAELENLAGVTVTQPLTVTVN